jgi:ABC-type proline/glycine betaine transport system ATPase subunit
MDEAFSALDPLIRAEMQDQLLDLQTQQQRTIVFISHDLDEAMRIGDRIAIMEGGACRASGNTGRNSAQSRRRLRQFLLSGRGRFQNIDRSGCGTHRTRDADRSPRHGHPRRPATNFLSP